MDGEKGGPCPSTLRGAGGRRTPRAPQWGEVGTSPLPSLYLYQVLPPAWPRTDELEMSNTSPMFSSVCKS